MFFFYRSINHEIAGSFFGQDLLWFIPNFVWQTQNLHAFALIKYLLTPSLWFMDPMTKTYFFACLSLFGLQAKYFMAVALCVHVCNALLFYFFCRRAGLSFQVAYFSALSMLFFFAQFHAYLWPMAFQHVIIVFFVLLGLNLYLKTDGLIVRNQKITVYWSLSLFVNLLASFCRFNVIILPIMMLTHILFCSSDDSQKIRKLKIWLPIIAVYLGNPLFSLVYVGDNRANLYFASHSYWVLLFCGITALTAGFYGFKGYVKLKEGLPKNFERYFLLAGALLVGGGILYVRHFSNSFFAIGYSLFAPFIACFKSFLEPLQTAQSLMSAVAYYLIPVHASIVSSLLVALCILYFILVSLKEHKALLILFVWYLACYVYLVHQDPIRSRYFIYLAPLFSVIFCVVVVRLIGFLFPNLKRVVIPLLFALLFVSNISAIKLALFREKLVNTLDSYEYIKAATLIKEDISGVALNPEQLLVLNLPPIPFRELGFEEITPEPTDDYFIAKTVFRQIFGDKNYFNVSFQKRSGGITPSTTYVFDNGEIERDHKPIDPFFIYFNLAKQQLKDRRFIEARESFLKAIQRRPFLFRYVLGKMEFDDLRWVGNGGSFSDWLNEVKWDNQSVDRDFISNMQLTFSDFRRELNATMECLFYLSYLENRLGNKEQEMQWIHQLKALENDYTPLQRQLMQDPIIASDTSLKRYTEEASKFFRYQDWSYYSYYVYEKFLLRLAF